RRAHRRPRQLHRLPAPARGEPLAAERPPDRGEDGDRGEPRADQLHHPGDLLAGRLVRGADGADPRVGGGELTMADTPKSTTVLLGLIALGVGYIGWSGDVLNYLGIDGVRSRQE